jgi:hypothetical protein
MVGMRVAVLVLPLLLIPGAQTALSQDSFGRIEGTVVDQTTGAPVSGASVTISPGEVGWAGRSSVSVILSRGRVAIWRRTEPERRYSR